MVNSTETAEQLGERACKLFVGWYDSNRPSMDGGAMAYELVSFIRQMLSVLRAPAPTQEPVWLTCQYMNCQIDARCTKPRGQCAAPNAAGPQESVLDRAASPESPAGDTRSQRDGDTHTETPAAPQEAPRCPACGSTINPACETDKECEAGSADRLAAPGKPIAQEAPAHTDHPLRHWDRTCPACIAESQEAPTEAVHYERVPALDRRISKGDDFAGDAWVRWTAVGRTPEHVYVDSRTVAWLVERDGSYWDGRGPDTFIRDHLDAIRFSRKDDGERMLHWLVREAIRPECVVTEHVWL